MNRTITALTLAVVGLIGLTACTASTTSPASSASPTTSATANAGAETEDGGSSDAGQSVAEACALVQQTMTEATEDFEGAASADPAALVDAMRRAAESVASAASQVSNEEVAALLPSLEQMFGETSQIMQALVDGDVSKLGEMAEMGESFQQTTDAFQKLCAG